MKDFSTKIYTLVLAASLPSYVVAIVLLWQIDYSAYAKFFFTTLLSLSVFGIALLVRQQLKYQFQTLSNLVEAIRGGDFTLRGKARNEDDALAELTGQINLLSSSLSEQRIASEEAYRLLDKAIAHINVAIFAFDINEKITLVNPAAGRLFACDFNMLFGQKADELGLAEFLVGEQSQLKEHIFPGGSGRWQIRLDSYRDKGIQSKLLFITDLKAVLREEELKAWKNLIKVISHEVNNSLYPISSISQTLSHLANNVSDEFEAKQDVVDGLKVIGERANNLTGFIKRYAQVAKLPEPHKQLFTIAQLSAHIVLLKTHANEITLNDECDLAMEVFADLSMFEQVMINLLKNALEAGSPVVFSWGENEHAKWFHISDNGSGIKNPANLFVPFYSTKPSGSGIGLVLCQQIIDKHNGTISIQNKEEGGCVVKITIPRNMG